MKRLCKTIFVALILGIAGSQLALYIRDRLSVGAVVGKADSLLVFTAIIIAVFAVHFFHSRKPRFPRAKLKRIREKEGYSPAFYRTAQIWQEKCVRRGYVNQPTMKMSDLLFDGGYFSEGFEMLSKIDFNSLNTNDRIVYFNAYLYRAISCGDKETADRIYEAGREYLITVDYEPLCYFVKHTLGCYEYMRGNLYKAEELFMQSFGGTKLCDVICEDCLGLSVCYLDTGRLEQAKHAVETASEYAVNESLKQKTERAKRLVEEAFKSALPEQ